MTSEVIYSSRFKELLGYRDDEIENKFDEFFTRLHPDDRERVLDAIDGQVKARAPYDIEYRLQVKSGEYLWFRAKGKSCWDQDGCAIRMTGSLSDITEQKKSAVELEQAISKLELSNKELEQYTYIASHDLRSPLVNLSGFADELRRSYAEIYPIFNSIQDQLTSEQRQVLSITMEEDIPMFLGFINDSIKRMEIYSSSILELSRLGRQELRPAPVKCTELLENIFKTYSHQLKQKNIEIEIADVPDLVSNEFALNQLFGNLIDNAIKYTVPKEGNKISVFGHQIDDKVLFTITDTGIGIPQSGIAHIFEIFQRGNHDDIEGNGMGLAYVKALVGKLSGEISCQSVEGEGTSFTFMILDQRGVYEHTISSNDSN